MLKNNVILKIIYINKFVFKTTQNMKNFYPETKNCCRTTRVAVAPIKSSVSDTMQRIGVLAKAVSMSLLLLLFVHDSDAQCTWNGSYNFGAIPAPALAVSPAFGSNLSVASTGYATFNCVSGVEYMVSTCDGPWDSQITGFNGGSYITGGSQNANNATYPGFYNDDNGADCATSNASIDWRATYTGTVQVLVERYSCGSSWPGTSTLLKYRQITTVTNSTSTASVCQGSTVALVGSGSTAGSPAPTWSVVAGTASISGTTLTANTAGTVTVRATIDKCYADATFTVLSTANNPGAISVPASACQGSTVTVSNTTAATTGSPSSGAASYYYYWQRTSAPAVGYTMYDGPTSNLTSNLPTAVTNTPGTYLIARNSAFPCTGQANNGTTLNIPLTIYGTQTMSLTSGSASPTLCKSTTLGTNTVYTFGGGATSASITAGSLPAGMTGTVVGSTFVIAGTPSVSGSFPYTVTSSGAGSCSPVSLGGTITVNNTQTMSLTGGSASPTICKSTALGTNTVYTFGGGATSASITAGALPAGMLGSIVGSTFVISGTPSVAGSFPYTVTSSGTGNCSPVSLAGTVTVYDVQSMSLTGGSASPTLCKSTALGTNTVYTFGGGATAASITAGSLPAGMTGTVVGSTFVIAGTPSVSGSFPYTVTTSGSGSCSPVSLGGTITVNNTQTMTLTGGSASPSVCKSSALGTNTVYTFGGGATSASITAGALPAGMTGSVVGSTFVIAGTPSVAGSFSYTVTSSGAGSCSPVSLGGTITVNDIQTMSLTGGSASPSVCKNSALGTNTVYTFGGGATSASITAGALPAGMTGSVVGSTFVIAGTPSVAGSFSYTVTSSGSGGCSPVSLGGTITVNDLHSMTLTGGSASPSLCKSSALGTNTVYTFGGGATSASITAGALPAGMLGSVVGSTFVISGTPSVAGSFSYTVTTSGTGGCSPVSLGGTITVNDLQSMSLTGGSASPTLCKSTTLGTNTVYTFGGGATAASITAGSLPAGMTGAVVGSTFVISGTPSVSGSFPYTVTTSGTGSCTPISLGGTITVNNTQSMTLTGGSASPTLCQNSTLGTNTVYTFGGGATSASITAGALPAGMTGTVVGSTFVIAGTPSAAGSFAYTVTSSGAGSCSPVSLGGTITVTATPTPTFITIPSNPICTYTNATYETQSGQSAYTWSGFGTAGVDYNLISGGLTATDNIVTIQWIATGTKSVSVGYTSGTCPSATPATNSTVVNGSPTPTISTSGAYCTSNSIVYSTQAGQSSYVWTVSGTSGVDYTPISGGSSTDATYTIQWITSGSKTVTVNYTNTSGCPGPVAGSTTNTITVGPTSATLSDVIDGCNGGHTATVTFAGGTSPFNFTVCGTPYTNMASPASLSPGTNTSCSLTFASDANGCAPGTINGSPYTFPARVLTSGDTYACTVSTGATKVFYDHSGNLMVKITDGGGTLGATTVVASVDGSVQQFGPTNPQSYLQRHFKISPTNTSGSASVCLYLSDAEASALNIASASDNHLAPSYYATFVDTLSNAVVTKFHGAGETPLSNVSRQVLTPTSKTHNPVVNGITYNNVWEVCMNVTSWSGFYVHAQNTNNTPLPVTLLYLTADAIDNKYIQLDWATASEINNQGFEIERSTDGANFERIGWVDGHGTSNSTLYYSMDDKTAQPSVVYYYRLKQVDIDGHFVYTEIVSASLIGDKGFVFEDMIPNPAINTVQLGILTTSGQRADVTITDMLGRVVATTPWQLSEGYNTSIFDISSLAEGTYNVTVYSGTTYTTKRLVVTK